VEGREGGELNEGSNVPGRLLSLHLAGAGADVRKMLTG
jgi:hypothetical protein